MEYHKINPDKTSSTDDLFRHMLEQLSTPQIRNVELSLKITSEIFKARERLGLSIPELAELLNMPEGVFEDDFHDYTVSELCNIADKLNIKFDLIFESLGGVKSEYT